MTSYRSRVSELLLRNAAIRDGIHPDELRTALRRSELVPLQRGIYLGGGPASPVLRAEAALLAVAQPDAAASHMTAARAHGLVVPLGGPEHVTLPRRQRRPHRDRLRLHTARLPDRDVDVVGGLPVTAVPRTLVDLCRELRRTDAVWAVEQALVDSVVTVGELEAAALRLARTPGIITAREWFRAARPLSGSPLETEARLAIVDAGLPEPELQVEVQLGGGRRAFLDLAYPELKIGIELDGRDHERVDAAFRDRWRQNSVHGQDWVLYRFTWRDVRYDRERMIHTLTRARAARRHT
ncbi:MAG TPA: hypothetical protein VH141_06965 [Pseudonocardia sp.]|jgi:hypothetical protein|nr:hypothetical protein [Pseudonocardia sp.]